MRIYRLVPPILIAELLEPGAIASLQQDCNNKRSSISLTLSALNFGSCSGHYTPWGGTIGFNAMLSRLHLYLSLRNRSLRLGSLCALSTILFHPWMLSAQQVAGSVAQNDTQRSLAGEAALLPIRALIASGKFPEADVTLREYLRKDPASSDAQALLAFVLFREAKPQLSLDEYTRLATLRQPTADDLKVVALDYVLLNDYEDASKWMAQSLVREGGDAETWYDMGRITYTLNRFQESVECFQKSLQLLPGSVKAETNLGLAMEGLNRNDEAVAAYRQAITWQQNSASPSEQPLINLGIVLVNREQFAEALPLLLQARAIAPKEMKVHEQLARLYLKQDDLGKARDEMERAVELAPGTAGLHFQLGQIYKRLGLTARARTEFAKVGELSGGHSTKE